VSEKGSLPLARSAPELCRACSGWRPSLRTAAVMAVLLALFAMRSRRKRLAAA
jgi:hypothetical protein